MAGAPRARAVAGVPATHRAGTHARAPAPATRRSGAPTRALNQPRPARVRCSGGLPAEVDGEAMQSLRESWLVEDRWWAAVPLRRRYWELVGERGRNVVVFHDLCSDGWFHQAS